MIYQEGKNIELQINNTKSVIITNGEQGELKYNENEHSISCKTETIYLGQLISFQDGTAQEVTRIISLTWEKF